MPSTTSGLKMLSFVEIRFYASEPGITQAPMKLRHLVSGDQVIYMQASLGYWVKSKDERRLKVFGSLHSPF
jgi:hypothetical protein